MVASVLFYNRQYFFADILNGTQGTVKDAVDGLPAQGLGAVFRGFPGAVQVGQIGLVNVFLLSSPW